MRTTHGTLSCDGLVPLHPSFDTVTWLAADAGTFERVAHALLPPTSIRFRRVLRLDDAAALADAIYSAPLQAVAGGLAEMLDTPVQPAQAAPGEDLTAWRQVYATAGAHEGWRTHGAWITQQQPEFGPAIAARF